MENFKVVKKSSLLDKYVKADGRLQRASKTIGALIVIIGAVASVSTWISDQFQNVIATQIAELRAEVQALDKRTEQQITRLELANLIHNQPHNKAEIEKVARYYFIKLDGDWYMTGLYSTWATENNGDISFIVGKE